MRLINRQVYFFIILSLFILSLVFLSFHLYQRINLSQLMKIRDKTSQFLILSPLVFCFAQILQILFPIIPGNVLNFAGGYIFGVGLGSLLSILGVLAGSSLAFLVSRYLGRKALIFFLKEERLKKFDNRMKNSGPFLFFLFFLLPNPIGDIIFYLYGLTKLPFSFFLPAVLIGRAPGIIFSAYLGARALSFTITEWVIFATILILFTTLFYLFKDKILALFFRRDKGG